VGRWHRPREESLEDTKGRVEGEVEQRKVGGWERLWEPEKGAGRIDDLEGVT
jgi:hypothetical protein